MKNEKYLIYFLIFIFLSLGGVKAECNFNTSNYIDELNNSASIKKIELVTQNYRKWSKNAFSAVKNVELLQKSNKKKFKSKVKIIYNFGACEYRALIRLHGDKKDHLDLENGKLRASLDVELKEGNIKGATNFKLFLPETRFGNNEIFASLLLKKLGFISPDTFNVKINLNDLTYLALFQEKARKELIEKSGRVEGPIFEGDEEILWVNEKKMRNFYDFQLEKFSASRLTSKKWAQKNNNSLLITLSSFSKLQEAYFNYAIGDGMTYLNPNSNKNNLFSLYDILLMSMNGFHALRPHNRKFFYNLQEKIFEPIYYDGYVNFDTDYFEKYFLRGNMNENDLLFYSQYLKKEDIDKILSKIRKIDIKEFVSEFKILSNLSLMNAEKDVKFYFNVINLNLSNIERYILRFHSNVELIIPKWEDEIKKLEIQNNFQQNYISINDVNTRDQEFIATCLFRENCIKNRINFNDAITLMQRNIFNKERSIIYNVNSNLIPTNLKKTKNIFNKEEIISSPTAKINFDKKKKIIYLTQENLNDWFLFKNQKLENFKVMFKGLKKTKEKTDTYQRINKMGLTGCVTFYNVLMSKIKIYAENGQCEDTVNIINGNGAIEDIEIFNASSDGLDLDFSNLSIDKMNIKNSINDCSDFSYGNYQIINAELYYCGDKGVSVGEKSNIKITGIKIEDAYMGVAAKDSSNVFIEKGNFKNINVCLGSYNKKQEFFGANLYYNKFHCNNYTKLIDMDQNSSINKQ